MHNVDTGSIMINMADETDDKCDISDDKDNPEKDAGGKDSNDLHDKGQANN